MTDAGARPGKLGGPQSCASETNLRLLRNAGIWNLGTHDFEYDFTIFFIYMNSYMNS